MIKVSAIRFGLLFLILCSLEGCERNRHARILILGNSITHNGPVPSEGWYGDWGMAASSASKDYVHQFVGKLTGFNVDVTYEAKNIAYWEVNFNYDFTGEKLLEFKPDILIIRLGENVPENAPNYEAALTELIRKFGGQHVIITSTFWPSSYKDNIHKKVAEDNGYKYVDLSDLAKDGTNQAGTGTGFGAGVAIHPSDLGMNRIASKLYSASVRFID